MRHCEFGRAALERALSTANHTPAIEFVGLAHQANLKLVNSALRSRIYQAWDAMPDSPAKRRPREEATPVALDLEVLGFANGKPFFPQSLVDKFVEGSDERAAILKQKTEFEKKFPQPATVSGLGPAAVGPGRVDGTCDFTINDGERPLSIDRCIELPNVESSEFADGRLGAIDVVV